MKSKSNAHRTKSPRPSPRKAKKRFLKPLLAEGAKVLARQDELQKKPATDEQLARIWLAWNALPIDMLSERRRWILTDFNPNNNPTLRHRLEELRQRFPDLGLPFDAKAYNEALNMAENWVALIQYHRKTIKRHQAAVEAQLGYSTFDNVLTGRVAIYRAVRELDIMRPNFLHQTAPSLADIAHLCQRYSAYLRAREDAIALLHPLVFLAGLRASHALPLEERAIGVPHPPERFPGHIYIARLAGWGKCGPARLAEFFAERFLKLSLAEQIAFCEEYHRPTKGRQGMYVFLAVWMADNAPLFKAFKMTWRDILAAARQHFNERAPEDYRNTPEDEINLKVFWRGYENKFWPDQPWRIAPPAGRPRTSEKRTMPASLLTPLPFVPAPRKG